jgi:SSS family solute:Na+ symporter
MLLGAPIVGLWYWGTDQYIVQRTLAARNLKQARRGTIFGAFLKLSPVFLFILPGMIAYALSKSGRLQLDDYDQAFPVLVKSLLPAGLRGLVVGGLLAALMSSLSSLFNSCSTLFTVDIYEKIRPGKSEKHLVFVGRVATTVVVFLGIVWIPVMKLVSGALYEYLQSVQAYLAPPITAVFFLGVFSKRINARGALVGLIGGFLFGMLKLVCQIFSGLDAFSGSMPAFALALGEMNFLYFCILLFVFSIVLIVGISLISAPPAPEKIESLTYSTLSEAVRKDFRASWNRWDVINTCIILAIILGVYIYFTG